MVWFPASVHNGITRKLNEHSTSFTRNSSSNFLFRQSPRQSLLARSHGLCESFPLSISTLSNICRNTRYLRWVRLSIGAYLRWAYDSLSTIFGCGLMAKSIAAITMSRGMLKTFAWVKFDCVLLLLQRVRADRADDHLRSQGDYL